MSCHLTGTEWLAEVIGAFVLIVGAGLFVLLLLSVVGWGIIGVSEAYQLFAKFPTGADRGERGE